MDWNFPRIDGGQFHGIGDSGIDLFKGDPVKSLTREICQNSIDAMEREVPVEVEFKLFTIKTKDIPGFDKLKAYFETANKFCEQQNFKKAIKYFKKTIPLLEGDTIDVLRISDFNTKGLRGASTARTDFTTPWFRLVRSVGSSDKADGSIGAFGSGKMATFSCSDLQTVFYSTYVEDECTAYQGVSKIIGFLDEENHLCSDIGYYSEPMSMPIMGALNLEDGFDRTTQGTDVYIIGFKFSKNEWQQELIASVLDGFFYAIKENHLIVSVDDIEIKSNTLPELMEKYRENIDDRTYDYYRVMTSDKTTRRTYTCMTKNDVDVSMLVESGYGKRVAIIRYPGMKVFDKGNISATVPFSGICVIKGKKIATLLGGLENIQHNKWELSRYDDDPETRKLARKERDNVYSILQRLFKELRGQDEDGEIDPNIGDCLPDPLSDTEEKKQALTDDIMEISKTKEVKVSAPSEIDAEDENGDDVVEGNGQQGEGSGGRIPGPGPGPGPGPNPAPGSGPGSGLGLAPGPEPGPNQPKEDDKKDVKKVKRIKANVRFKPLDVKNGKYKISIIPSKDISDGFIEIFMGAESGSYESEIIKAVANGVALNSNGNRIKEINIAKDTNFEIKTEFNYSDVCSLEVKVYGH